jgi:hypothetical protein
LGSCGNLGSGGNELSSFDSGNLLSGGNLGRVGSFFNSIIFILSKVEITI